MKEFYYLNTQNQKLDFTEFPYLAKDISELENYEHNYDHEGNEILDFYEGLSEIPFSVNVYGDTVEEYEAAANRMFEVTEYDVKANKRGKLYYGNQYVLCNLISNIKDNIYEEIGFHESHITMITDHPYWIHEVYLQFIPTEQKEIADGLDFPTDFPFDFAIEKTGVKWINIEHYTPCDFKMRMYGPCTDPCVTINGHPYQIITTLESGEYLEVDSKAQTIIKYMENGTTSNLYNSRLFEYSVFKKIPCGESIINWNGTFGFELIVYMKRSELKR